MLVVVVINNEKENLFTDVTSKEIVPNCNHYIPEYENYKYCPHCGYVLKEEVTNTETTIALEEFTKDTFTFEDKIYKVLRTKGLYYYYRDRIFIEILEIESVDKLFDEKTKQQDLIEAVEIPKKIAEALDLSKRIVAHLKKAGYNALAGISDIDGYY